MKKLFLSVLIVFTIAEVQAQTKTKVETIKPQTPTKIIKTIPEEPKTPAPAPAPAPPPASARQPATKQELPASTPVYSLTSVRVRIRTGNDNKEFPSKVFTSLCRRSPASGEPSAFSQMKLDNEMKINSDTEFGMERVTRYQTESKLDAFQSSGLKFTIKYWPNFFADAWKIESVTLVLEFKDQFGNLHPTLGSKIIVFSNAYGFLNSTYWIMECETDGSFAPLTAVIKK